MQAKLEEVLEQKEREFKLYRKFLDLRDLCETRLFPNLDVPLGEHIAGLKDLIEKLIPDPRDRNEEMFSGEIFALLGTLYLHDISLAEDVFSEGVDELFGVLDRPHKTVTVSNHIGRRLNIPVQAMEVINYLSLSDLVKKFSIKWEIKEDGKKAIIRNTKVLGEIFNFAHLLLDILNPDLRYPALRRNGSLGLGLSGRKATLDVDAREGLIRITCRDASPYEIHHLKSVRSSVDSAFHAFKSSVNGKLGLQYRGIIWDVAGSLDDGNCKPEGGLQFLPYGPDVRPALPRWEEASSVIDKMIQKGGCLVVGEESVGKTTVLTSFVFPQVLSMIPNTFYCRIWTKPVHEIRDVICKRHERFGYSGLDITSICNRLLDKGPCVFLLDGCESVAHIERKEREKLERFLNFCRGKEGVYVVASGEKESFFDWFTAFSRMELSSVCEIGLLEGERVCAAYGDGGNKWLRDARYKPFECELARTGMGMEGMVRNIVKDGADNEELRSLLSCLVNRGRRHLERFTVDQIRFETCLSPGRIVEHLCLLEGAGLVARGRTADSGFYCLANRCLTEPLHRILKLDEFEERRCLRTCLKETLRAGALLEPGELGRVRRWMGQMLFSKEEMGLILTSLIAAGEEYESFMEGADREAGIDIQPILGLIYSEDAEKRRQAIALLIHVQDKGMINPLLRHLKREKVHEIKDLLVKGMGRTKKRRTMIAIVQTLREIGDRGMRLKAIQFFCSLFEGGAEDLLLEIRETEDDPEVVEEVNRLLSISKPET